MMHSDALWENASGDVGVTSVAMVLVLLLRKKTRGKTGHAQNILPVRTTSGSHVIPLGRILRNFRLRMHPQRLEEFKQEEFTTLVIDKMKEKYDLSLIR
jgi:hypothetical protein